MHAGYGLGERLTETDEPFIPLVEEALGLDDVPADRRTAVYKQTVPLTEELCTESDTRETGTRLPARIACSPAVFYAQRGEKEYSLRLVLSNRRLSSADYLPWPTVEIELLETNATGEQTKRTIAAMSHSILVAGCDRNRYNEAADLEGFVSMVGFIRESLTAQPSD